MNISQHSFVPLGFYDVGYYDDIGDFHDNFLSIGCSVLTSCSYANCIIFFTPCGNPTNGGTFRLLDISSKPNILLDKLSGINDSLVYPYFHSISDVVKNQVFTISFYNYLSSFGFVTSLILKV